MDRNLRILAIGVAIRTLGAAIYNPFLALFLVNVLGISYLEVGIIIAAIGLLQLPVNLLGGFLTDRVGRRRLILLGLTTETLVTGGLAYAFAIHSLVGAIAAATVGGFVLTAVGPAYAAYIADFAAGSERTRAYTAYRIGFNVGFSIGVAAGGVLIATIGFAGAVLLATGIIGAGALFLGFLLAASPLDAMLGHGEVPVSASVAPTTVVSQRTVRQSFALLVKDRPALELLLAIVFAGLVVGQWGVTFPLFVHNVLGVSYYLLGLGLALNGVVVVFGQSPVTEGVLGRRHTSIAIVGIALYALAFVGLGAAGLYLIVPSLVFFVAVVVLTFGENLLAIPQSTLPSNLAPAGEIGAYNGAFAMMGSLGFILSVLLGGIVLEATANPLVIWGLLVLPAVPAVALLYDGGRRIPRTANTA